MIEVSLGGEQMRQRSASALQSGGLVPEQLGKRSDRSMRQLPGLLGCAGDASKITLENLVSESARLADEPFRGGDDSPRLFAQPLRQNRDLAAARRDTLRVQPLMDLEQHLSGGLL